VEPEEFVIGHLYGHFSFVRCKALACSVLIEVLEKRVLLRQVYFSKWQLIIDKWQIVLIAPILLSSTQGWKDDTVVPLDIKSELLPRLKGKVLLIGAGNTLRGDDGVGPAIVGLLEGKVNASLLDAGEVPESYLGRILAEEADTIVLLDAADFGGAPGDLAVLEAKDMAGCSLSTHRIPMDLLFQYLKENGHADLFALGIQPEHIGLGEPMSAAVEDSVHALAGLLRNMLSKQNS
jgi:hydrogenase 3 maturation protease